MMLSGLSVGGVPAVSFSIRVNKLRALCSRRHSSPWPVLLSPTLIDHRPKDKPHPFCCIPPPLPLILSLCMPSPLPPRHYLPHLMHLPVFHLLSLNVSVASSVSSLPSFLSFSFMSSSSLLFCHTPSACQSCLQPCIISWTELLWVWSRSGSGSTRLITENTPVCPASSFSSAPSLYSQGLFRVNMWIQMVKRHNEVSLGSKTETRRQWLRSH